MAKRIKTLKEVMDKYLDNGEREEREMEREEKTADEMLKDLDDSRLVGDAVVMTERQKHKVEWLRDRVLEHDGHGDGYEYKKFELHGFTDSSLVWVISEVGKEGDEDTMASVFCRTMRHIMIGPRGGMTLVNAAPGQGRVHGQKVTYYLTR